LVITRRSWGNSNFIRKGRSQKRGLGPKLLPKFRFLKYSYFLTGGQSLDLGGIWTNSRGRIEGETSNSFRNFSKGTRGFWAGFLKGVWPGKGKTRGSKFSIFLGEL